MNTLVHNAIKNLHEVLKQELGQYTVSAEIYIDASRYTINCTTKTPEILDAQGISMRNISGDFIG